VFKLLCEKGFSVEYVPRGAVNSLVARLAKEKEAVLVTRDSGFADTFLYPPEEYYGIVVLRIHPPLPERLKKAVEALLRAISEFRGKTIIVYEDRMEVVE